MYTCTQKTLNTETHAHAQALHKLCTQFNLFELWCLLCYGYNTNTSPGRFHGWKQQTHLPLIPWAEAVQPALLCPDGCFDKCFSFRQPMSCTSVRSFRKWWKMCGEAHKGGGLGLITSSRWGGTRWPSPWKVPPDCKPTSNARLLLQRHFPTQLTQM